MKTRVAIFMLGLGALVLTGCGASGPKTPLSQEQFAEMQVNCNLSDARLGSTNRTEKTTTADGIPLTITRSDAESDAVTIFLSTVRSESAMGEMIICVNEEFERLNAEAGISLPDGQI